MLGTKLVLFWADTSEKLEKLKESSIREILLPRLRAGRRDYTVLARAEMKFFSEIKEVFQLQFNVFTSVCMSNLLNPVPTGTCRNQPIYEYYVITAVRNRVKSSCNLAKHHFSCLLNIA